MLPVSGETKTESLITEPINFILSNKVKDGTDDTLPDIRYKDAIDAIQHSNEIIDNNIFIVKKFLLPRGEDGEFIRAQVKARAVQFDQE